MTDEEFDAYLETAQNELADKQAELSLVHSLGQMKRWWFDQEVGKLEFFDDSDKLALEAEVIVIGSYSPKSTTWKWSWSNQYFTPKIREQALLLKDIRRNTGFELFENANAFAIEGEAMAWELTAIAVHELQARGCYRAPSPDDGPHTFFAITNLCPYGHHPDAH